MKLKKFFICAGFVYLMCAAQAQAQFNGFSNQGMVGVGRIPANSFDRLGENVDTLGGMFSAMAFDQATRQQNGNIFSGTLYGLPDRGFGDGAQDFRPRLQRFGFSITPYYGTMPVPQNQVVMQNNGTLLFTKMGVVFTGFDASDPNSFAFPRSNFNSLGEGRHSLDAEGLALRTQDGGYWISDEYGPFIYRFDSAGRLQQTITPPDALIPKVGAYPRLNNFNGTTPPTAGRTNNRGLEGLSLTPDGRRLVAMLQSPTVQDSGGGSTNNSLNTRILIYDVEQGSPTNGQLIAEYVYVLTNQGSAAGRSTPISALYALNNFQFLILERDNIGLGGTNGAPLYKKVNLADVRNATNIAGTGYDLEAGAPGALQFPATTLPAGITPAARLDFVNIIDQTQLAKFGLNANATRDQNSLSEKWEGLALIPLRDANAPNDFLLLVGNDNDFKSATVFHNGTVVGTNNPTVDSMILAYRVTLPATRQSAVRKRDFDGDGKSDLAVFRNGTWFILNSGNGTSRAEQFGFGSDRLVSADYDGDERADLAVYRNGSWFILNSPSNTFRAVPFGLSDDVPAPADYDGDGRADIAVFRPGNGTWYLQNSLGGAFRAFHFGLNGDRPVPGDYDGDGTSDIAIFRPSNGIWAVRPSSGGGRTFFFGASEDLPVPGDYDGDGQTDYAVFRPSTGTWFIQRSSAGFSAQRFGQNGDVPVTGDYDGDGRNDLAVFRGGTWFITNSANNSFRAQTFGFGSDVPVQ
ncbi:MAG: esterase-like activity of phytase family protein [Pyrinomonadaceae bacterium]|nr:esterase-like activity of phytase family protein [Pyrinomonadaceae bacterium]